jgi:hypothetical protein
MFFLGMIASTTMFTVFSKTLKSIYIIIIIYFNSKWVAVVRTAVRHNTQITDITQNNTPCSNKTRNTELNK